LLATFSSWFIHWRDAHKRQQQCSARFQGKDRHGSTAPKAKGAGAGIAQAPASSVVLVIRGCETLLTGAGFGLRCQSGTHGVFFEFSGETSEESSGESWKSSIQSLPRIGEPAGKRSIASTSKVVSAGVVTLVELLSRSQHSRDGSLAHKERARIRVSQNDLGATGPFELRPICKTRRSRTSWHRALE